MKITPLFFEAFLKCPTKCYLRSLGEAGSGNEYVEWVRTQDESYEREAAQRLRERGPETECFVEPPAVEKFKSSKWRFAVNVEAQAPCRSADSHVRESLSNEGTCGLNGPRSELQLESRLHAVERIPSEGRGRPAQFIPIRFIYRNKLTKDDKLLLAFDALVLSEILGRVVSLGKIIHGDDHATLRVRTSVLRGEVRKRIQKIAALLSGQGNPRSADSLVRESPSNEETPGLGGPRFVPRPPDLVLNRHCAECEFRDRCRQKAIEADDLSLLAGMSAKERQKLRSKGIFTVTQLSYTFRPRRRPKRLRDKREKYHHSLKALAVREKKIHVVGNPQLKIEGTPVFLDVEGLPDRDFYYLVGLRIGHGGAAVQHSLWADTVEDEGKIWREFLAILETVEKPVLIHYGSYETNFFQEMSERHGKSTDGSENAKAIASAVNAISVLFAQVYFPTYANGLKDVAAYLGFKWSEAETAGLKTIIWRRTWEERNSLDLRERLITYNAEDCQALDILIRTTMKLGVPTATDVSMESLGADVVHTKSITRETMWGSFSTPISDFELINKAAQWDYQRERIYTRTDGELRRATRTGRVRRKKRIRVSESVVLETPHVCPRCLRKGSQMLRTISKRLHDLKFTKSGVKGWVVNYQFQVFRCATCRGFVPWPREFCDRTKYGRNLAAFTIYEAIELCVSQRSIAQTLNRFFGFQMNENVPRRLKASAAEYYTQTRTKILDQILKGNLVHADETRIVLKGESAYVWVFATTREVVYFYSESREGGFAQKLLGEFQGVLVSDFYAAYDSIPCPQQKCLIHLMRDLNDALLDNPYDTEVKGMVTSFGGLLKRIVSTIDRWGLKHHFLRKHKRDVVRFYRQLSKSSYQSEAAVKCKERFEKNQDTLFVFLDHNGVPWNNNNVEHAIKAFARLRRAIEGLSTPKGIEEYLILLSVCQTCKYMGVDFLDFLRSGEKDIHAFAESRCGRRRRTQTNQTRRLPPSAASDEAGGA